MTTQTKTTHTPGVWKVSSCSDGREIVSHSCGITFPIAHVESGLGKASGDNEARANARLISAAPELLESARLAVRYLRTRKDYGCIEQKLNDAIIKAEGRI